MSNRRYEVFKGSSEKVVRYVKPKVGDEWISRGLAEVIGKNQIRLLNTNREVVRTSDAMLSSGQRDAYELAAIEPYRCMVQGGGASGIRRQLRIDQFSGAKVGHQ